MTFDWHMLYPLHTVIFDNSQVFGGVPCKAQLCNFSKWFFSPRFGVVPIWELWQFCYVRIEPPKKCTVQYKFHLVTISAKRFQKSPAKCPAFPAIFYLLCVRSGAMCGRAMISPHFARACCLLLACLLAKPVRSTLNTKEG